MFLILLLLKTFMFSIREAVEIDASRNRRSRRIGKKNEGKGFMNVTNPFPSGIS